MSKLWWLTYQQKSDLWRRIWDRQAQLVEQIEPVALMNREVKQIVDEIEHLNQDQARALIYAYQVGGSFNGFSYFEFDEPGDHELVFWLWDKYRKLFK